MSTEKTIQKDPRKANIVRSLLIEKILRDRQPERLLQAEIAAQTGLVFPSRNFFLMQGGFFDSEDADTLTSVKPALPKTYQEILDATQELVLAALNNERFTTYSCVVNEDLFFVSCVASDVSPWDKAALQEMQESLRDLCMQAQQAIRNSFGMHLQIWSSDFLCGFDELQAEFGCMVTEDFSPLTAKPVMFPEDMKPGLLSPTDRAARQMQVLEQQVVSAAIAHNWEDCYCAFRQLIDIEQKHYPICNHIRDRAVERLTSVFSVGGVPMNNGRNPALCSHVWRENLKATVSIDDVSSIVKEVLDACAEFFQPMASVSARVPDIVDFVDRNLFDPNLCADMVCAEFDISISYLSRIFKERQNVKFIDYIHKKRVSTSKSLLLEYEPILTIQTIAERVGYSSALTYTRAFKRIEGMTPGAYRRLCSENEEVDV